MSSMPQTGFTLPPLPYAANALEPHIDAQTMEIHHGKHHAAYVNNLNAALEGQDNLLASTIDDLLRNIGNVPEDKRQAVINNGGGHANHTLFWQLMQPGGATEPSGALLDALTQGCGGFDMFKEHFGKAGMGRFGSGWAWLYFDAAGKMGITSTANQDSVLLNGGWPVLGVDVWEHAYYLKYQNRRADYLAAWWNVLNWDVVNERFNSAK